VRLAERIHQTEKANRPEGKENMKTKATLAVGLMIAALAAAPVAQAAVITWDPVVSSSSGNKFDSTGVNNEGDTVLALMVNSGGPDTVNGVTFLNWGNQTQNGVTWSYTGGPGTTFQGVDHFVTGSPNDYFSGPTDAERDAYIHAMAGARDGIETMSFSGLTVNQEYLVQVWAVDMRNNSTVNGYYTLALDGGTPSGSLEYFGPGGGVSSYVVGRFTADSTSGTLALGDAYRPQVNAIQLRAIPEPASLGMLGAAAAAMLLRRRFRG
jgi:hypothetical protein